MDKQSGKSRVCAQFNATSSVIDQNMRPEGDAAIQLLKRRLGKYFLIDVYSRKDHQDPKRW